MCVQPAINYPQSRTEVEEEQLLSVPHKNLVESGLLGDSREFQMKLTMAFASAANPVYGKGAAMLCTHHELPGVAGRTNTFFMESFT